MPILLPEFSCLLARYLRLGLDVTCEEATICIHEAGGPVIVVASAEGRGIDGAVGTVPRLRFSLQCPRGRFRGSAVVVGGANFCEKGAIPASFSRCFRGVRVTSLENCE